MPGGSCAGVLPRWPDRANTPITLIIPTSASAPKIPPAEPRVARQLARSESTGPSPRAIAKLPAIDQRIARTTPGTISAANPASMASPASVLSTA